MINRELPVHGKKNPPVVDSIVMNVLTGEKGRVVRISDRAATIRSKSTSEMLVLFFHLTSVKVLEDAGYKADKAGNWKLSNELYKAAKEL